VSVFRIKKTKDFVTIHTGIFKNPDISFKAKGLWAYCMSRPDDWEFHASHLATVSRDGIDAIYTAVHELEKHGYIKKVQPIINGKFQSMDYEVYETPQIQIILPQPNFPQTENPQTENPALPNIDPLPRIEEDKKSPALPPPPQAAELSLLLFEAIKKTKPDLKKPNLDKWAQQIDLMLRVDNRSYDNIKKVIEWLPTDDFWKDKLLSAEKLRSKFDMLELKMRSKPSNSLKDDLESIKKLSEVKDIGSNLSLIIGSTYVEFPYLKVYLKAGDKGFKEKLIECLRLNKMRQK
jgi:hypothetical protein